MNLKNSKEAILNQAVLIFGSMGYHKTTMTDIANASKRGRRTIYTYFKTKEEVYEAVIEREIASMIQTILSNQEVDCLPQDCFRIYLNNRLWAIVNLANCFDAFKMAYFKNYTWIEKIRHELDLKDKQILYHILEKGEEQNQFSETTKKPAIEHLLRIIKGFEFMLIMESNPSKIQMRIDELTLTLLNGLIKR